MKVLVVDDSLAIRVKLRVFLEDDGHEVYDAKSGSVGLQVLKENKEINIIVSDLNTEEMGGMTFIENARQLEAFKETPIYIYTTETSKTLKQQAKDLGVREWIQNPLDFKKLLSALKEKRVL
ncbi:response regulator [Bacteriovoracales bacterium]|nr:response regulator [Bacteriovoracales bacterium]